MGFPRRMSLKSSAVIGSVIKGGRSYSLQPLKLHLRPSSRKGALVAFAVPKYGHSIVERNRLKRQLQEIVRSESVRLEGYLAVVRCTPRAYGRTREQLREIFSRLVDRITEEKR